MSRVVVFGVGQIAEMVSFFIETDTSHEIAAYTLDRSFMECETFRGKPVIAWEDLEKKYPPSKYELFCPISYRGLNVLRQTKYEEGKARGYRFINYIHSSSLVYAESMGDNCMILENCVVQPGVKVGNNVILWSSTHIGHHSVIGDHCFIAGNGGVSGNVTLGCSCFLGGGSLVSDNVRIGARCIVGIGARVVENMDDEAVAVGDKARIIAGAAKKFATKLMR